MFAVCGRRVYVRSLVRPTCGGKLVEGLVENFVRGV